MPRHSADFLKLAAQARAKTRQISPYEMVDLVEDDVLLLDVREKDEYAQGHLHGSIHLSRGVLEMRIGDLASDKAVPIVCYCNGGNRGALAAETLQKMGYQRVFYLEGGMSAAQAAGLSIEPGKERWHEHTSG